LQHKFCQFVLSETIINAENTFIITILKLCRVAKVVAPKKESLKLAEDDLKREEDLLQIKRNELQEVTDKLQLLYDDLKEKQTKMKVRTKRCLL